MAGHERGMALVTTLFLLALLMILALVLGDRVIRITREGAWSGAREQALYAADAGIEWARMQLAGNYATSAGWATYLASSPGDDRYPDRPAFTIMVGAITVDIFLRDNPDGDGDSRHDNDLKLFVLSRARAAVGAEAMVEALCSYTPPSENLPQAGRAASSAVDPGGAGRPVSWDGPVNRFRLGE